MPYQINPAGSIADQDLLDETIVLVPDQPNMPSSLVRTTLRNCVLQLGYNAPTFGSSTIIDSEVFAKKRQRNHQNFLHARFLGCTFRGVYSGIDFGHLDDAHLRNDFGRVEDCDFTQATLDGVRFVNTDISTLRFPRWPHVVLPTPQQFAEAVKTIEWPGELGDYLRVSTSRPAMFMCTVLHIPSMSKKYGFTTEEARSALEKLPGVLM